MSWRERLFERGAGWLRWGKEERIEYYWEANACAYAPEWFVVAPPLRRLWIYLLQWPRVPWLMIVGLPPDEYSPKRYRFSWEEAAPYYPSDMRSRS